jgi:hypothetical protein
LFVAPSEFIVMAPTPPSWFKQRQCKAEPAGTDLCRVSGPNLKEWFIGIRHADDGRWRAYLRETADGPDVAVTEPLAGTVQEAWDAAFELLRVKVIV